MVYLKTSCKNQRYVNMYYYTSVEKFRKQDTPTINMLYVHDLKDELYKRAHTKYFEGQNQGSTKEISEILGSR